DSKRDGSPAAFRSWNCLGGFEKSFEIECQVARRLKALVGIFLEAMANQPAYARFAQIGRLGGEDCAEHIDGRRSMERAAARQHLVENRAEGKNIGPVVEWLSTNLLRRHVTHRAHDTARLRFQGNGDRLRLINRLGNLGQSEVQNLDATFASNPKILRLQI